MVKKLKIKNTDQICLIDNEDYQKLKNKDLRLTKEWYVVLANKEPHRVHKLIMGDEAKYKDVHHIDGNKLNNTKNNLICLTISQHAKINRNNPSREVIEKRFSII